MRLAVLNYTEKRYNRDGEGEGDGEGDEGRRRYQEEDEGSEINNVPCVIGRCGPNSVRL